MLRKSKKITQTICHFCQATDHSSRDCKYEKEASTDLKKISGMWAEEFVGNNLSCPRCKRMSLRILGNHTASLDACCDNSNCNANIEIKSKCISARNIPLDLKLPHGNFKYYNERQKEGLDFIIIIYSANRSTKIIEIRKILYIEDSTIKDNKLFYVEKNNNMNNSTIIIPNYTKLTEIKLDKIYRYNFSKNINSILGNYINNNKLII